MNSKLKNESTDFLFEAILTLETKEDCYRFFEDLCTKPELNAMAQRIVVAKLLTDKTVYSEIVKRTGASTATISRVNRSLNEDTEGYRLAFERLEENGYKL
jgi:TrpR-related protein YerC/YecD